MWYVDTCSLPPNLQILLRTNCTFELHSVRRVQKQMSLDASTSQAPYLKLKGQMMLLPDVGLMAFLCSPA